MRFRPVRGASEGRICREATELEEPYRRKNTGRLTYIAYAHPVIFFFMSLLGNPPEILQISKQLGGSPNRVGLSQN